MTTLINTESISTSENSEGRNLTEGEITFNYVMNKDNTLTLMGFSDKTKELLLFNDKEKCCIDTLVIPGELTVDGQIYQVSTIGRDAFGYTSNIGLKHVVLEEGITHIMGYFITGDVKSITFPSTLRSIDSLAFMHLSTEQVIMSDDNPYYCMKDNILYSKDGTTLVWAPFVTGTFTISEKVTKIAGAAFGLNKDLKKVVMHDKLTYKGDYAFHDTNKLNVVFPEKLDYIGEYAFANTDLDELIQLPKVKVIG